MPNQNWFHHNYRFIVSDDDYQTLSEKQQSWFVATDQPATHRAENPNSDDESYNDETGLDLVFTAMDVTTEGNPDAGEVDGAADKAAPKKNRRR